MSDNDKQTISELRAKLAQMSDLLEEQKAEKRLAKNYDFIQIARPEIRAIAELGVKSKVALELLMLLAQNINKHNAVVISIEALIELLGRSRAAIFRSITLLKEDNWIQVVKSGSSNVYILNSAVFWSDKGTKRKHASFTAKVVSILKEQEKDIRKNPHQKIKLRRVPVITKEEKQMLLDDHDGSIHSISELTK